MSEDERLATRTLGNAGPRVAFVHGLFGQGRNWTSIAKALAEEGRRVTLVDLPNHGHSPWTETSDYLDMARMVAAECELFGEPVTLVFEHTQPSLEMRLTARVGKDRSAGF